MWINDWGCRGWEGERGEGGGTREKWGRAKGERWDGEI